jgi:hypothetical protein
MTPFEQTISKSPATKVGRHLAGFECLHPEPGGEPGGGPGRVVGVRAGNRAFGMRTVAGFGELLAGFQVGDNPRHPSG